MVSLPPVVAARWPVARERLLQGADQQAADQAGIAEAHLGLGGVHVDVDLARIEGDEQRDDRMAVARQVIRIGGAHHADEEPVAHRPAVDEQILPERVGAGERRQAGEAVDGDALAARALRSRAVTSGAQLDRVGAEVGAQDVAEPRQPPGRSGQRRRPGHRRALLAGEREGDVGPAHGEAPHHLADRLGLAPVALEEFEPRRRGVEQVAHLDAGAFAERRGLDLGLVAAVDGDRPGMRLAGVAGGDGEPRHRADRGQRLAAEAERADIEEVVAGQLRGGVALDREREVGAGHAGAVVGDADQPPPAAVGHHLDAGRAGVERVLDELLDHARRALDHLAGGDAVDDAFGELADGHVVALRRIARRRGSSVRADL